MFISLLNFSVLVLRKKSQAKPTEMPKKRKSKRQLSKEDSVRDKDVSGKVAEDIAGMWNVTN